MWVLIPFKSFKVADVMGNDVGVCLACIMGQAIHDIFPMPLSVTVSGRPAVVGPRFNGQRCGTSCA